MLLIVSNRDDLAADFMITRPKRRASTTSGWIPRMPSISGTRSTAIRPASTHCCAAVQEAPLASVDAVWYRRAIHPVGLENVPEEFRRFAGQELRYLLEGLLPETGSVRWVNPIGATERAERKVRQLAPHRITAFRSRPRSSAATLESCSPSRSSMDASSASRSRRAGRHTVAMVRRAHLGGHGGRPCRVSLLRIPNAAAEAGAQGRGHQADGHR